MWAGISCWALDANIQGHDLQPSSSCAAITLAQHYLLEPTGKSTRLAKLIELLPRYDKRILSDVFGQISVTKHSISTGKSHILKTDHQLGECLMAHRRGAA